MVLLAHFYKAVYLIQKENTCSSKNALHKARLCLAVMVYQCLERVSVLSGDKDVLFSTWQY